MVERAPQLRLGDILVESGQVSASQVEEALDLAKKEGLRVGEALVKLGFLDQDKIIWALGNQLNVSYVDIQPDMIDWSLLESLPTDRLSAAGFLPISRFGNDVIGVVSDLSNPELEAVIQETFPFCRVTLNLSSEEAIQRTLTEVSLYQMQSHSEPGKAFHFPEGLSPIDLYEWISNGKVRQMMAVETFATGKRELWIDKALSSLKLEEKEFRLLKASLMDEVSWDFLLPGGGMGFIPATEDVLSPIHVMRVTTLSGALLCVSTITRQGEKDPARPLEIVTSQPENTRQIIFEILEQQGIKGIILEPWCTQFSPSMIQLEIVDFQHRMITANFLAKNSVYTIIVLQEGDHSPSYEEVASVMNASSSFAGEEQ